jgi:hydroxymethylpyrimidine/phosphomethylpyrimidine kinase
VYWSSPARILLAERENISSITPQKISNSCYSGLEADQKVIAAHGCYAMTATTALTAQNTKGVFGIHETPPDFVKKQINASIEDIGVDVIKTGISHTTFINQQNGEH